MMSFLYSRSLWIDICMYKKWWIGSLCTILIRSHEIVLCICFCVHTNTYNVYFLLGNIGDMFVHYVCRCRKSGKPANQSSGIKLCSHVYSFLLSTTLLYDYFVSQFFLNAYWSTKPIIINMDSSIKLN